MTMADRAEQEFLRSIFLMEAWDTVAALEEVATTLDRPGGRQELLVLTHRLRGAASLHGYSAVAALAAELERMLHTPALDPARLTPLVASVRRGLDTPPVADATDSGAPADPPSARERDDPVRQELEAFFAANPEVTAYFLPEAAEHLEVVTAALVAPEPPGPDVDRVFRAVHTLKGAAYVVGCTRVGDLAHRMEDVLVAVRDARTALPPATIDSLLAASDLVREMLGLVPDAGRDLTRSMQALLPSLLAPEPVAVVPAGAEAPPPAPGPELPLAPPPVRLVTPTPPRRQTIRVALERLDALMDLIGEMVIARSRAERRFEVLDRGARALLESRSRLVEAVTEFERRHLEADRPLLPPVTADAGTEPGRLSVSELFAELEFDRYDDAGIFARAIGEIAADVTELQGDLAAVSQALREDMAHIHRLTGALRAEIGRARLIPLGQVFTRFVRQGQEAARAAGKAVRIETCGESVALDTSVIEEIVDPLLHLVQNAVTHGLEGADERRALGKPPLGTVTLAASHESGVVVLEVTDDGRGIDPDVIRARAVAGGFVSATEAAVLTDQQALELVFLPGLTTAPAVTAAAGRGVGMDVVRTNVRRVNGDVEVASTIGRGTRFTLRLPLTVLVSEALLVKVAGETLAVPLNAVKSVTALSPEDTRPGPGGTALAIGGDLIRLVSLASLLRLPSSPRAPRRPVLVVRAAGQLLAVEVDEVLHRDEIVIKPLPPFLAGIGAFTGGTVSAEGQVTLLLDTVALAAMAAGPPPTPVVRPPSLEGTAGPARARILLVDDSVSVRKFVGQMLEKAGFDVCTAADGADAVTRLEATPVDLVVTDLEMPRMNGYELIEELRRRAPTRATPVVVLTTRAGAKHVALARQLGVSDYVTKPVDEQAFVALVASLASA